jgi:hypothetical protein
MLKIIRELNVKIFIILAFILGFFYEVNFLKPIINKLATIIGF